MLAPRETRKLVARFLSRPVVATANKQTAVLGGTARRIRRLTTRRSYYLLVLLAPTIPPGFPLCKLPWNQVGHERKGTDTG